MKTFAVILAAAVLPAVAAAQEPALNPTTQPSNQVETRLIDRPGEIIAVLPNGMTVIVVRYPAAPVVSVQMHVRAGSLWEDEYAGSGISHLFEHLLHGADTARRSERDSRLLMEKIGASTNAYTSQAQTVYYINAPKDHAATAIDLLADWITRPLFEPATVERELGVVQRELERGLQEPDRQLYEQANLVRYLVSPARHPVIGYKSAVAKLSRDDIIAYYRRMYVPDRVVFAVVGDVEPEATLAEVKKQFADFAAAANRPSVLPAEPAITSPRGSAYPMDVAQVRFLVGFPTVSLLHDDLYPLDVMAHVMGTGESSRLTRELRDRRGLALSVSAFSDTPAWGDGSFYVGGMCQPEKWPALYEALLAEFDRLAGEPLDAAALAQAKRQALVGHIRSQQTAAGIASSLASSQLAIGDAHFDDQYVKRIGQVTAEQVQQAARKYFDRSRLLTTLVNPRELKSPGIVIPGRPATQSEAALDVTPIRKVTLDNGLTVLLRRNTAAPLVAVQMHFRGGLLGEPSDRAGVSNLMTQSALRGTKSMSAARIFDSFEQAGGRLASNSGRNSFSFFASTLSDQLETVLPVFAEVIKSPSFPADEVARLKTRTLAAIDRVPDRLESSAQKFFFEKYFGDSPYGRMVLGRRETVEKLTSADLQAFHRRFVVAPNAVLAVFGDIDPDQVEQFVRKHFADLPGDPKFAMPEVKIPGPPTRDERFVQASKLTEAAEVDIGYAGVKYSDPDYYPLVLMDTITSGYGLPGGWLHETLRGRQLVYIVHASSLAWDQAGLFYAYAQCQPGKVNEVADAIKELLAKARAGQFTCEELERAKGQVIGVELMENQTNDELAQRAALDELLGRGYDSYMKLADQINAVTLDDVKRVAAKYLTHSVTTITTGGPEAAALKN